jgi:hypothetical protein
MSRMLIIKQNQRNCRNILTHAGVLTGLPYFATKQQGIHLGKLIYHIDLLILSLQRRNQLRRQNYLMIPYLKADRSQCCLRERIYLEEAISNGEGLEEGDLEVDDSEEDLEVTDLIE